MPQKQSPLHAEVILPVGLTCWHRMLWFFTLRQKLALQPRLPSEPPTEGSIVLSSKRWHLLHRGRHSNTQTQWVHAGMNMHRTDKKDDHRHAGLHHTQRADVWKFPVQSWHQGIYCVFKDADLTLLRMTGFTKCNNKKSESNPAPENTKMHMWFHPLSDILAEEKRDAQSGRKFWTVNI